VKYDLLIFDLDGTLIDTSRDIAFSANAMLGHYGLDQKSVEEITGYVGDGIAKLVERCLNGEDVSFDEAVALFKKSYAEHLLDTTAPYPGVVELLEQLNGVRKALLTNKSFAMSRTITDRLGLSGYFEIFVGGDTLQRRKPHPDGVLYILEQMNASRQATLLIGDGRNDILTARAARVRSVFVSWGFSGEETAAELSPDFIVERPHEVLGLLQD
jgi:phosphoglycolate phosphatase